MKKLILLILISLFILNLTVAYAETIDVTINGIVVDLVTRPLILNNRIVVPLRGLFEAMNATVDWSSETKTITVTKEDIIIVLQIDNHYVNVNGEIKYIDVPAVIYGGSTFVPARFVSETLGGTVEWVASERLVKIEMQNEKHLALDDLTNYEAKTAEGIMSEKLNTDMLEFRTTNFERDYFRGSIENSSLTIEGSSLSNNNWVLIQVRDETGEVVVTEKLSIIRSKYEGNIDLSQLKNGDYSLNVFMNTEEYGLYLGIFGRAPTILRDGEAISFSKINESVYENNLNRFLNRKEPNEENLNLLNYYTRNYSKGDFEKIRNLAVNITAGVSSDYEKVFAISNWISDNIYYDYDYLFKKIPTYADPLSVIENKRAVCAGYAILLDSLAKSIGIPSQIVSGHALGITSDSPLFEDSDKIEANHSWNEVYVDNRWVIIDSTWNSQNKYQDGKFERNDSLYTYFDSTLEFLTVTHYLITD
jgi:hypothetical protein